MARLIRARKSKNDHRRVAPSPAGADGFAVAEAVQRAGRIRPEGASPEGPGRAWGAASGSPAVDQRHTAPAAEVSPAKPALGGSRSKSSLSVTSGNTEPKRGGERLAPTAGPRPRLSAADREQRRRSKRRTAWQMRHDLRPVTTLQSVKKCGWAVLPMGHASIRVGRQPNGKRVAGIGGVMHCGSVWACPKCGPYVSTVKGADVATMLKWALDSGYSASLATFTVQHFKKHTLKDSWDALTYAWGSVTGGKQWVKDQVLGGMVGWVKVVEVTCSCKNGWHPHVHALIIWDRLDSEEVRETARWVGERMWGRWVRALRRKGYDAVMEDEQGNPIGFDIRHASLDPEANELHQYFTKMAFEVTGGQAKEAKGRGRTPMQILADAMETGLADDWDLWFEWEQASKGRKQMTWSDGLREAAGLCEEKTDEEIAAEERQADESVTLIEDTWYILRRSPVAVCELLDLAEDQGIDAVCDWLSARGLPWYRPGPAP